MIRTSLLSFSLVFVAALGVGECLAQSAAPIAIARGGTYYRVEIDGVRQPATLGVEALVLETEVIVFRDGSDPVGRKLPGRQSVGDVTIKRGVVPDGVLWNWYQEAIAGTVERRTVSVIVTSTTGVDLVKYDFLRAFPVRWSLTTSASEAGGVLVEEITLTAERAERTVLSSATAAAMSGTDGNR